MVNIRHATDADIPTIVEIVEEIDRFYGSTEFDEVSVRRQHVAAALFSASPAAYVLLAEEGHRTIGLASYSFLWPAEGTTTSVYLKELYVSTSYRKRGVGRQMLVRLGVIALERGCSRVEWTTDRDNIDAQKFYQNLGAEVSPSKLMYRVDGGALARLAAS